MRAPSQEGQHFHLPSARVASPPPRRPRGLPPCRGARGPISQYQLGESPAHPLKSIATVSKDVKMSIQVKRDLPECSSGVRGTKIGAPPPPQTRARGLPASLVWVPATQARPALHSPGEEFASDPAQQVADPAQGAQRLGLRDPRARRRLGLHGSLRASCARNPAKCPGPENRRRRL